MKKKQLVAALAAAFVVGVAGTAFANNPFVDVPAKHWAYEYVNKLAKAGVVDGYGDGTFRGDKQITRYEMAVITAKAMAKLEKADADQKMMINKLSAEFGAELDKLGVRVSNLEKNSSTIKFTGDARLRYRDGLANAEGFNSADKDTDSRVQERIRLYANAKVSDKIDVAARFSSQWANGSKTYNNANGVAVDYAKFSVKDFYGTTLDIGRQALWLGQGLLADTAGGFDAAKVTFGNKLKVSAAYGNIEPGGATWTSAGFATTANRINAAETFKYDTTSTTVIRDKAAGTKGTMLHNVAIVDAGYNFSKDFGMTATYFASQDSALKDKVNVWAVGAKATLSPVFKLTGEYAQNTKSTTYTYEANSAAAGSTPVTITADKPEALWLKLDYKGAKKAAVGTWGAYADYRDIDYGVVDTGLTTLNQANNVKGWGLGFNYTLAKNTVLTANYEKLETKSTGADLPDFTLVKVDFNF